MNWPRFRIRGLMVAVFVFALLLGAGVAVWKAGPIQDLGLRLAVIGPFLVFVVLKLCLALLMRRKRSIEGSEAEKVGPETADRSPLP
jgi:hypothetical protein